MVSQIQRLLGFNIKRLRSRRRWTAEQLAQAAGLSAGTIRSIETGRVWLGVSSISAIAKALSVNESDLFASESLPRSMTPQEAIQILDTFVRRHSDDT